MRKAFGVLAFLSFLAVLGTVGAIEQDMVSLGAGTFRAVIALGCMWLFTRLAGGFDPPDTADQKETALGVADRKAASVKAQQHYNKL